MTNDKATSDKATNDTNYVGFYKLIADEECKHIVGALLVTDELGKPEEFRVTYPVKPTLIQRQLYGLSLLPHVGIELCGVPLYEVLRSKPPLLIVSHPELISMAARISGSVVYLEKAGTTLVVNDASSGSRSPREQVESTSGRFDPIRVTYPSTYSQEQRGRAAAWVTDLFNGFDLLEPFDRIDVAIRMLKEQDERFR